MLRRAWVAILLGLVAAGSAAMAGTAGEPVAWHFDFGYSMIQGTTSDVLDDGLTIGFGAVIRPNPKSPIGWRFDVTYDWWDVKTGNLPGNQVAIDDGDGNQWGIRGGIQYEGPADKKRFFGGAGIGGYRLHANVTNTVLVPGYICDPYYWGWCYPGLVEGEVILADNTLTKFGYYVTAGFIFPLDSADFYIEAQYQWVNVEKYFQTLPIVVGWRF